MGELGLSQQGMKVQTAARTLANAAFHPEASHSLWREIQLFPQYFILKELKKLPSPDVYFKNRKAMYCTGRVNADSGMDSHTAKAHGSMDDSPSHD